MGQIRLRKGLKDNEYQSCINGLGLLQGEQLILKYICFREIQTILFGKPNIDRKKGLLVFTNDNLIFMQLQGNSSSQALRMPLEQIRGVSSLGRRGFLNWSNICFEVDSGITHTFDIWKACEENSDGIDNVQVITEKIQKLLNDTRAEKKRLAKEALAKGAMPAMIFCKFCGARNKADETHCNNCNAPLS